MVSAQAAIFALITRRQREALLHSATRDSLTGALNRTLMSTELERALAAFNRHGEISCVLALDLDHFKRVNDNYGHDAGDKVLVDFARIVAHGVRLEDQFFRHGGEEFLLLIRNSDAAAMQRVATLIHERVAAQLRSPGGPVTVSIGGAQVAADESAEQWLQRADKNLYAAKTAGRSTSVLE
jgi:diguanylate cyclase (GGDEF)-like protein